MKSVSDHFNDQPRNPDEIIFIWHHNLEKPTNYFGTKNGPDSHKYYNHFTLLEPMVDNNISADIVFPHEDHDDRYYEQLDSPNIKKVSAATFGSGIDIKNEQTNDPIATVPTLPKDVAKVGTSEQADVPDAPLAVRIMREPCMKEHINLPGDITELYFSVIDNEGTGDCFFQVILDSTVFQRENAHYGPDNVQLLRTDIQRFAKRNEALSQKIFDLFYDQKQKEDFAIWNLQFSCQSNDREDSNWAFEFLSKNKDYLKEIKKKKILSKTCRKLVKGAYEKDEYYCNTKKKGELHFYVLSL
jgi:hypothetical protein